jgi:polysaccharide biosynthesis transport protein
MNDISFPRSGQITPAELQHGALAAVPARTEDGSLLRHYLLVVRRRKWLILGSTLLVALAGLIFTLMITPQYTAETTVEIQRDTYKITGVEGVEPETTPTDMEFYQTQYGLLRAESLAQRVATDLRLFDNPDFFGMFGSAEAAEWFEDGRLRAGAPPREVRVQKAGEILRENIGVAPVRLSRLVSLSFTSPDPALSARVANAWAEHFIKMTLERRFEATSYARRFLEDRLNQLRTRLEGSERALVGYAAREGIVNVGAPTAGTQGGGEGGERSIIADDLMAINRELAQATADRITAQSRLQASGRGLQESLTNETIGGLRRTRAELSAEYSSLMVRFEPGYPAAVAVRERIEQLDRAIEREEARVRNSIRGTYDASVQREASLAGRVGQLKGDLLDLRRRSIQYNIYQREVDTNRELYNALLQRYKEIGIAGGIGVNNVSIVDPARPPEVPSSPRLFLNLLMSLLAGAGLGFVLAFAREQIDDAVVDPSEVENALKLPMLGAIPKSREGDLVKALDDRKSDVSEAYLTVQTNLSFSTTHGVPRTLTVTSTCPGEGKSTTALALASSLARTGSRVLLVDGDMRSPSVHKLMQLRNDRGLSNYLAGDDNLPSLIQASESRHLSIMPAGPQPPSAAELLSGERLDALIRALLERFDYIVVDAPPVMGLADAPLLGAHVEGVVFVLESHSTKVTPARVAIGRLRSAHASIIGAVLTKFDSKRGSYGYGYGYGDKVEAA